MAKRTRKPNIGDELIESMREVLAYMRGEKTRVRVTEVATPTDEISGAGWRQA